MCMQAFVHLDAKPKKIAKGAHIFRKSFITRYKQNKLQRYAVEYT